MNDAKSTTCEEANLYGLCNPKTGEPYPCSKPATHRLECAKDDRIYAMCECCAAHNVRRGMKVVETLQPRTVVLAAGHRSGKTARMAALQQIAEMMRKGKLK